MTTIQEHPNEDKKNEVKFPYDKIRFQGTSIENAYFYLDTFGYNFEAWDTLNDCPNEDVPESDKRRSYIAVETYENSPIINVTHENGYGTPFKRLLNWTLNEDYNSELEFQFIRIAFDDGFLNIVWDEWDAKKDKENMVEKFAINSKRIEYYEINSV